MKHIETVNIEGFLQVLQKSQPIREGTTFPSNVIIHVGKVI